MSALNLRVEEPGYSIPKDNYFAFLAPTLQPASLAPAHKVVAGMIERLQQPYGKLTVADKVPLFFIAAAELADQIPYDHPSMDRLVDILDAFLDHGALERMESLGLPPEETRHAFDDIMYDTIEILPQDNSRECTNICSFLARVEARGLPRQPFMPGVMERSLCDAFDVSWNDDETAFRESTVMSATQWVLICGRKAFDYFLHPERYPTLQRLPASTLQHWQDFRRNFSAVANGERDEPDFTYSDECKALASRAAAAMLTLEEEAGVGGLAVK